MFLPAICLVLINVKYLGLMKMVILSTFNQVKILFMLCTLWKILLLSNSTCWNQKLFKRRFFTTSKIDHHLLCQKVRQRISVMKKNSGVFVVFKTKRDLKFFWKHSVFAFITEILWRTFWSNNWQSVCDIAL